MTDPADSSSIAFALGKIDGQMREVIHKQNNMEQKLDGLVERSLTGPSAADFATVLTRLAALEAKESERKGASGIVAAVMKSPVAAWVAAVVGAVYIAIKEGLFK